MAKSKWIGIMLKDMTAFGDSAKGIISHPKGSKVEVRKRKVTTVFGHETWTGDYEYHITRHGKKGDEKHLLMTSQHPSKYLEGVLPERIEIGVTPPELNVKNINQTV